MFGDIFTRRFKYLQSGGEVISPERHEILKHRIAGLMAALTLLPLLIMSALLYAEDLANTAREASNNQRALLDKNRDTIELFLAARVSTVAFIAEAYGFQELSDPHNLGRVFQVMCKDFDGFMDLGLIDATGRQVSYVGPYDLNGRDYSKQEWFDRVRAGGKYISNIFLGFRNQPHVAIAVRHISESGESWTLRATLDTHKFDRIISAVGLEPGSDAFLVNRDGILQTDSSLYGHVLSPCPLPLPPASFETRVIPVTDPAGRGLYLGYASLPNTDFMIMSVRPRLGALSAWYNPRWDQLGVFAAGVAAIFFVVYRLSGFLLNRVRESEERRAMAFRQVEHAQKLSSLGRLAAGVAHEINNPLAIINEKAGLMKDLLGLGEDFKGKERLTGELDDVIKTVERCSNITHSMLGFARRLDVKIEGLNLNEVIDETAGLLAHEAEQRRVNLVLDLAPELPRIESDRGRLQQVILNILNNSLAAISDRGSVVVKTWNQGQGRVAFSITDTGCGMSEDTLKCIFEPFYTTKGSKGTGLGLSITHGIVKRLGGEISVSSQERRGTTFTIVLPVTAPPAACVEVQ